MGDVHMETDDPLFCATMFLHDATRAEKGHENLAVTPILARVVASHLRQLADRVKELETALEKIATGSLSTTYPFVAMPRDDMQLIARAALSQKDTQI